MGVWWHLVVVACVCIPMAWATHVDQYQEPAWLETNAVQRWNGGAKGNNFQKLPSKIIPFKKFKVNPATKPRTDNTQSEQDMEKKQPHAGVGMMGEQVVNLETARQNEIDNIVKNAVAGRIHKRTTPKYTVNDITTMNEKPVILGTKAINVMPYQ